MMDSEEAKQLLTAFQQLGVKPKSDSPEALKQWMFDYLNSTGSLQPKEEQPSTAATTVKEVTNTVVNNIPRISFFSGEPDAKSDTSFELWKYEVTCLMNDQTYSPDIVLHAVRKSLKGEAALIVMRLGVHARVSDIIDKLHGVFGNVEQSEDLLAKFYSSHQHHDEDIATWSCRLENLLHKALGQCQINPKVVPEMLRKKFWNGLRESLKSRSGHKFDTITDYDELRIHMRRIEYDLERFDHQTDSRKPLYGKIKATTNMNVTNTNSSSQENLAGLVHRLCNKVDDLQQEMKSLKNPKTMQTNLCSQQHSYKTQNPVSQNPQGYQNYSGNSAPTLPRNPTPQVHQRFPPNRLSAYTPPNRQFDATLVKNSSFQTKPEPQCWRCGQFGHLQHGCRVLLNKPLNPNASTTRGEW